MAVASLVVVALAMAWLTSAAAVALVSVRAGGVVGWVRAAVSHEGAASEWVSVAEVWAAVAMEWAAEAMVCAVVSMSSAAAVIATASALAVGAEVSQGVVVSVMVVPTMSAEVAGV